MTTILLTTINGDTVWLNVERIIYLMPMCDAKGPYTFVSPVCGRDLSVRETPKEICKKIYEEARNGL